MSASRHTTKTGRLRKRSSTSYVRGLREQINTLEKRVSCKLEEKFTLLDNCLQTVFNGLRSGDGDEISKALQKAKAELLVTQSYEVVERNFDENEDDHKFSISSLYDLKTERKVVSLKFIDFEKRKPTFSISSFTEKGELSISFSFFSEDEVEVLKEVDTPFEVEVKMWERGQNEEGTSKTLTTKIILGEPICIRNTFTASTTYSLKMRIAHQRKNTQWSNEAEFTTPKFEDSCIWKECPDNVVDKRKYSVDKENPRIATKINDSGYLCTIIGNTPLPPNKVTSWSIRILKSEDNDGGSIYIGVGPSDINQNEEYNWTNCGWYFYCYLSELCPEPPHNYSGKEYGPRKMYGQYVHTGDSVGVMMDTTKGELSFVLNGVNLGVSYEGIPLDKPLVPCMLPKYPGDSVELII